jgi:hypothetical protein
MVASSGRSRPSAEGPIADLGAAFLSVERMGTDVKIGRVDGDFEYELGDGGRVSVMAYDRLLIDSLEGDLAEGATFTMDDGTTVTRRGEEAIWVTPRRGTRFTLRDGVERVHLGNNRTGPV